MNVLKRGLLSPSLMEAVWWRRPSTLPVALLVMALVIIVAGGTIRINDAGESCPDWPQCFGTWGFDISVDEQTPRSSVHLAAFLKKFEISISPVAPLENDPVAQSLVSVRHSQLLIAHL